MRNLRKSVFYTVLLASVFNNDAALAEPTADGSQVEMQQRLNEQVLSQPSNNVENDTSLTNSLNGATERGKPTRSPTQTDHYKYFYNGYYYPYPYRGYYRY